MKKQWISVKCGLSRDPKHRQAMGESIWLFLHMLDTASWDDGICHEWTDQDAAEEMGMPVRTLREHRRKLAELEYITCNQKQYTQDIIIHNWTNPREYNGYVYNKKQGDRILSPEGDTQGSRKDVTPTYNSNNKDILDGILDYQLKPQGIRDSISRFFRLTPNWEAKYNRQFLEWSVEINMTPEQIETAANVWRMDKRFNWAAPSLKGIQEHWLELITDKNEEEEKYHVL